MAVLICFLGARVLAGAATSWEAVVGVTEIEDIHSFLGTCPSLRELAILQSDFPIVLELSLRVQEPIYTCYELSGAIRTPSDQLAIIQALRVIRHMRLSRPLPWTDLHPYEWLKSRIGAIAVSDTASFNHCCHTVFPIGKPQGVQAMTLQKADDKLLAYRMVWRDPSAGTGMGNLILLILHEARHIDLPHDCDGIDDSSLRYMGAWGVQITVAQYLAAGWIDIGLSQQDRQHLAFLAEDLQSSRLCDRKD
ncbi:hypothetical protein KKG90_10105 [Candidatus Bipolaricaulota bacterium]|nr:hypothetical protein [Candidatus Bipolaricaulota bacterium]